MNEKPKPFLPQTIEMTPEELRTAHQEPVTEPSKPSLRTGLDKKRTQRGIKGLIGAAVVAWAGSSLSGADASNTNQDVEVSQSVRKVPTEHEIDSAPWVTLDSEGEKETMMRSDSLGVEARAHSRRVHTWETYLKFIDRGEADAARTQVSGTDRNRIIYRSDRIERLQTGIAEKIGPEFLNRVTQTVAESCRGIILGSDLPKSQEEASVVIDTAIQNALRLAYVFSETIREFVVDHPEFAERNYSALFQELRNRAADKREMESNIPDLRRANTDHETGVIIPQALPDTEALNVQIAQDQFDLLGQRGEALQFEHLRRHQRDIRVLAMSRLAWFEEHQRQIASQPDLKEQVIHEFSYLLARGLGNQDEAQMRERLFHLRARLLRAN